jgi:hypothetical protein
MTLLPAILALALPEWPSNVMAKDLPRNVQVVVQVQPKKIAFALGEPVLCEVLIRNGLSQNIRVPNYATEPNSWNGETAFVRVVDIYRTPKPVGRSEFRPRISHPQYLSGNASHPVKPGEVFRLLIDLRKWPIVGGWTTGEYRFNVSVDVSLDSYASAQVLSDFAAVTIR